MMKYSVILLDADDTLLDFKANERESLSVVFAWLGLPLDDSTRELYAGINAALWRRYEAGEIDRATVLDTRFQALFEQLGKQGDGRQAEAVYRKALGEGSQLVDGALEVCRKLAEDHALYIVTNGVYETQMRRLEASGLAPLMKGIFVSEAVGHQKPSGAFFEYVFAKVPGCIPSSTLIVGDSLSSDIAGGIGAGIDTCWFNPGGATNPTQLSPTYEIAELRELTALLYEQTSSRL